MERPKPARRADFPWFRTLQTRWMDNDLYGHVNNVLYYSYFDTLIAHFLMEEGGIDPWHGDVLDIAVETGCRFHRSFKFPEPIEAGLRVTRVGNSSVRWEIGLFHEGADAASADGHFVHVFCDRATSRPIPIPDRIRAAIGRLLPPPERARDG
jgi:acyl-CoA thioester hydrolase